MAVFLQKESPHPHFFLAEKMGSMEKKMGWRHYPYRQRAWGHGTAAEQLMLLWGTQLVAIILFSRNFYLAFNSEHLWL